MNVQLRVLRQVAGFVGMMSSVTVAFAEDKYVAATDGVAKVNCICVVAISGCQSKLVDALGGKERHTWTQDAFVKGGATHNLDQLCFRKRDVAGAGAGLCCEIPNNEPESTKSMFRGAIAP